MIIRKANPQELNKLLEIYAAAKRFMETHGNPHQWSGADAITAEKLQVYLDRGELYVGEENGILHFSLAYIPGEDPTYRVITEGAWPNDEPYGTIHRLASAGTHRGVVKTVTAWALAQCPNLRIDTHHDNTVMQNALSKAGFTRCGIIFLANGDPRIAYQKSLPSSSGRSDL